MHTHVFMGADMQKHMYMSALEGFVGCIAEGSV